MLEVVEMGEIGGRQVGILRQPIVTQDMHACSWINATKEGHGARNPPNSLFLEPVELPPTDCLDPIVTTHDLAGGVYHHKRILRLGSVSSFGT